MKVKGASLVDWKRFDYLDRDWFVKTEAANVPHRGTVRNAVQGNFAKVLKSTPNKLLRAIHTLSRNTQSVPFIIIQVNKNSPRNANYNLSR